VSASPLDGMRHFKPSGPVSKAFVDDRTSLVKALLGPVGGGKSVACVFDSVNRPSRFMPACNDGVIRYRRAIIGSTYGQLERNLYPTWWRWLPKDPTAWTEGEWQGGGGRFAIQKMSWDVVRGGRIAEVRAEYIFAAIGDLVVEEFMRGFEPTDIWGYELDQLPQAVVNVGITRLLRYPPTSDTGAPDALSPEAAARFQPQISGDLNAPDTGSWFYRMFEEGAGQDDEQQEGTFKVYKQPSGRSPQAENLPNLPPGYYDRQVEALSKLPGGKYLVKRMVDAQYGPSRIGDPVFEEYSDELHLAPSPLKPLPHLPLVLGFDQGLGQPACVGGQRTPKGQSRMLLEVVPGRMNARRFAARVREEIADKCPGIPLAEVHYCDPAGFDGADKEAGDSAWAEIVAAELGIVIVPTDTNEIGIRLTAVVDELLGWSDPGVPAFVLCPTMKITRKGFVSHYMFDKRPAEKSQQRLPVKNLWSNPLDAIQYWHLGLKGRYGTIQGRRDPRAPERAIGHKARYHDGDGGNDGSYHVLKAPVQI